MECHKKQHFDVTGGIHFRVVFAKNTKLDKELCLTVWEGRQLRDLKVIQRLTINDNLHSNFICSTWIHTMQYTTLYYIFYRVIHLALEQMQTKKVGVLYMFFRQP